MKVDGKQATSSHILIHLIDLHLREIQEAAGKSKPEVKSQIKHCPLAHTTVSHRLDKVGI